MKRILTEEKVKETKNFEQFFKMLSNCYQETLDFVAETINPVSVVDEPLLCAALEAYAGAIKGNMDDEAKRIYKALKELPVTGASMGIKKQ